MSLARCTELNANLSEAKQRLHELKLGDGVRSVATGSERTDFVPPSIPKLEAYIAEIEAEMTSLSCSVLLGENAPTLTRKRRGPLRGPVGRR